MNGRALVAWNLRRLRVKRGLSQERLAYDAEVDRSYVGGLERRAENPTVDVLDRLAATLEVPLSEFFNNRAVALPRPSPFVADESATVSHETTPSRISLYGGMTRGSKRGTCP